MVNFCMLPIEVPTDNVRSAFSKAEKKNYISAVKCMAKLPPKTPKSVCPGCRNRYDDFVATHIQQTFSVITTFV
jgi:tyrosinase